MPGDIFDETAGPGSHLAEGTRRMIEVAYRRWLGFLSAEYPDDLRQPPADRITPARVRAFVEHLDGEVRPTTVAHVIANLYYAARLIDPNRDWRWLKAIGSRLAARGKPINRFDRLVPGARTLDFGIELMDTALDLPATSHWKRHLQYRDGLIIAFLSLWPIRRRSIAALTVDRHLVFDDAGVNILLDAADTKAKRAETLPAAGGARPLSSGAISTKSAPTSSRGRSTPGLWPSKKGGPTSGGRIYDVVRTRIIEKFGKDMCLHDFRRVGRHLPRHRRAREDRPHPRRSPARLTRGQPSSTTISPVRSRPAERYDATLSDHRRPRSDRSAERRGPVNHARRHLRPLQLGESARGIDRRSDRGLQTVHRVSSSGPSSIPTLIGPSAAQAISVPNTSS